MDQEKITSVNEILPSDIYIRDIYDKHGYQATVEYIDNHIKSCEQGEYYIAEFATPSGECTRQEFIEQVISKIVDPTRRYEARISVEPIEPQEQRPLQLFNNLLENNDLFELLDNAINNEDSVPVVPDMYIHEEMMIDTYNQYVRIIKDHVRTKKLKDQIAQRFAYHVSEWSHQKFKQPAPNDFLGLRIYHLTKYAHLKALMPNITKFRPLLAYIDTSDEWVCKNNQTEDGPF